MKKWVGLFGLFMGLLASCGSSGRNSQTKALVGGISATSPAPKVDTALLATLQDAELKQVDSLPTRRLTVETAAIDSANFMGVTPEQKLQLQKRDGINKAADWASAIHYDNRKPNYVIIHHTSQQSTAQTVRTFQLEHTKVSSHYVIGRDGQVIQMLNDYDRAWHAGKSKWGSLTDMNSISLGIELDNNGREAFSEAQIDALLVLLDTLKTKYQIPALNFIGHGDVAPTRKDDPNVLFPWKKLAEHGFGVWYNEDYLPQPPSSFNPLDALKIIGYDMSKPAAAISAFKRKFLRIEGSTELTDKDKAVLYDLYRKYY